MGTNSTFFFQPGIKSRVNPLTAAENQKLTSLIGKYHDKRLSEVGSLFYSEEDYDDFTLEKDPLFQILMEVLGFYSNKVAQEDTYKTA